MKTHLRDFHGDNQTPLCGALREDSYIAVLKPDDADCVACLQICIRTAVDKIKAALQLRVGQYHKAQQALDSALVALEGRTETETGG